MTAWANAHPGGAAVLKKFNDRDASKAFEAADHSAEAYAMLKDFAIDEPSATVEAIVQKLPQEKKLARARRKLFTREDPIGIHKYLGLFCLINFIGRFRQMLFLDHAAGLGTRGHPWFSMACLIPHAVLSMSSLIFHTVPRERVVGKPMIWKEYRVHNIIFGVRSVLAALAASLAIRAGNTPTVRRLAVAFSCACVLLANYGADLATDKLRAVEAESTTATMPYWEGCSLETQKRFKGFYAYSQFLATLACLATSNPAWPLSVLLAIQIASLLMTLVRKGLVSARAYHYGYTASLALPYIVGLRSMSLTRPDFPIMIAVGYLLFQLRRRGVSKYLLWGPVVAARFLFGDALINYSVW
jgi:tRNA(Leu) C34 or U34 (ribose-2'-O)-methylase TrmL